MKDHRSKAQKLFTILLSVMLCITLMPVAAFAVDEASGSESAALEQAADTEQAEAPAAAAEQDGVEVFGEDYEVEEYDADVPEEPLANAVCEHELVMVDAVEATCQHTGHESYRQCTKCGAIFDAIENKEIDYQNIVTPIADHKWVKTAEDPATSSHDGKITYTCSECGTTYEEVTHYVPKPYTARRFTMNDYKLRFSSAVVKKVPSFMKESRISHVWIKAYKKKIVVKWDPAENMNNVDGVIIMRKTGKASKNPYKEIKRIAFNKTASGVRQWEPKFSFTDKTAKKKSLVYTYLVIAYKEENGYTYISRCSDWASGLTTLSKQKNAYKANINKGSLDMQYNDVDRLKVWHSKPKKFFNPYSVRWYSDDKNVAKVSSKGKVTAVGVGSTTIRARLASGRDVTCDVSVVGAFTPDSPDLKLDFSTDSSIHILWNPVDHATAYDVYVSDDGIDWDDPIRTKRTKKKIDGLRKGNRYYFYVVAVNVNKPYIALSEKSNVLSQKAVFHRRKTSVSGWPTSKTLTAGSTFSVYLKITTPTSRKARLQIKNGRKWVTMKTVQLPRGAERVSIGITFPNTWWGKTTQWRLYIPKNNSSSKYTSRTLTIKSARRYQNPGGYVQISDSISKHGYSYYVSPVLVNSTSTRSDHIEALIKTASKYKGDSYVNMKSGAPGYGIDASGLVIQSCYGAGVDLWPISPSTRPYNCVPRIMDSRLASITYTSWASDSHRYMTRGDLVFFQIEPGNYGHVAIYLGMDKIIHASPVTGRVETSSIADLILPVEEGGLYGYDEDTIKVRRIFN